MAKATPLKASAPAESPSPATPLATADPTAVAHLTAQVVWQLRHSGELVIAIRDHRRTENLRDIPFRHGISDPIPANHPGLPYFLERPNEYLVAPAEAISLAEHQPSLLEQENAALKRQIADLEARLAPKE